ncbi:hypothetical protein [Bifidobacterium pseudolongum]|uniref:hypothetical protein n=1 Tax=Bifidobacterium pseudolongum TaxID=1694 RepID=UPI00101FD9FA|nr:hypothetical protein [Bifidobacterium pseudolongum]RYQ68780.1 hypothetical protein PG2103B_1003 [Bifidobacterium pseudolongum subsp. globosum]
MSNKKSPDEVLLDKFVNILLDNNAYEQADILQSMADAGEWAAGLDYSMLYCTDLGIVPDAGLLRSVLQSPWCEKDSDADEIGHALLKKAQASVAS